MVMKYDPEYPNCPDRHSFQSGLEFQDFVATMLHDKLGITITNYGSKNFQWLEGENKQGIEIKLDRLSIEIAEKTKSNNLLFVPSGIYRHDNTWLYVQGNPHILFIFAKSTLILLHKSGKYKMHEEPTIKAFYLPFVDCYKYAATTLKLEKPKLISEVK
jgi:hypothetical protein